MLEFWVGAHAFWVQFVLFIAEIDAGCFDGGVSAAV